MRGMHKHLRPGKHLATDFVHGLSALLADDTRVEAFWLEAGDDTIQWPPYEQLDLHFAATEPHMAALRDELESILSRVDPVRDFSRQDAPLKGFAGSAVLSDGSPMTWRLERTSQIAKVPRRCVNVLLDRSAGLLITTLSFE
jgi:hypothetical protein